MNINDVEVGMRIRLNMPANKRWHHREGIVLEKEDRGFLYDTKVKFDDDFEDWRGVHASQCDPAEPEDPSKPKYYRREF